MKPIHHFELKIDDKLSLVIPRTSHAEKIFPLIDEDREHLSAWLPWVDETRTAEDTRQNLVDRIETFSRKEQAAFYGTLNGEIVASVGYVSIKGGEGEIGYWLLSKYIGKGLMTSFVKACIDYGFGALNLSKIMIKCAEGNVKSAAIPERLGFTKSDETGVERIRNGEMHRTLIYTLNKANWCK